MKIKINQKYKEKAWQLGDVIADTLGQEFALIVKDNNGRFVAMDISNKLGGGYSTKADNVWDDPCDTIKELQSRLSYWHKMDATLVINGDFKNENSKSRLA